MVVSVGSPPERGGLCSAGFLLEGMGNSGQNQMFETMQNSTKKIKAWLGRF
jgi:hypothetical protein